MLRFKTMELRNAGIGLISLAALLGPTQVRAADAQATFETGMNYYGSDAGKSLTGSTGYFLQFQTESRKGWARFGYGAALDYSSSKASLPSGEEDATLIAGMVSGGMEFIATKASYVKPFITTHALFGWASLQTGEGDSAATSIGLTYGFRISGGAEIRFKRRDDAMGIRISTAYRYLVGSLGGVSGFQLNALQIGLGLVF